MEKLIFMKTYVGYAVCKQTKLKTTNTGIIVFIFIPHRKPKNSLCNKYSDIRFQPDIVLYRLSGSGQIFKTAIRYIPKLKTVL